MKNYLCILAFALISSTASYSQENSGSKETAYPYNNKIGFAASFFSGYGLSYEYNLNRDYTIEFTGSIYGSGGSNNSEFDNSPAYLVSTLGTELHRNFYVGSDSRFYSYAAFSYWIDNTNYHYTNSVDDTYTYKNDIVGGLGLGWEYILGKRLVFNLEGGYLYRSMNEKGTRVDSRFPPVKTLESYSSHNYYLGFGVGAGIYYAF